MDINDFVDDFCFDKNNSLDNISGKEFDEKLDVALKSLDIGPLETNKLLTEWAVNFETFLCENRTFDPGLERARIMKTFLPY